MVTASLSRLAFSTLLVYLVAGDAGAVGASRMAPIDADTQQVL